MAYKKLLGVIGVLLFCFSFVSAVTVTDVTPTNDISNAQNFATINTTLQKLSDQVESYRVDDVNLHNSLLQKSDLQGVYENMVNIGKLSNQDMLVSNIVLIVCAFALFFIMVAKSMLPSHRKEDKLSTTKENTRLNKEIDALKKVSEKKDFEIVSLAQKLRGEKRGWFNRNRPPLPSPSLIPRNSDADFNLHQEIRELKQQVASNGIASIAESVNVPMSKKRLFKKKEAPLPEPNSHLEALKQEFNDPKAKWRAELEKAKMRVDILQEMNDNLGESK